MKFSDFLGNEAIVSALASAVRTGRVANAYLLSGPSGLGKRTLATICAQTLLCTAPGEDACGECPSCMRIRAVAGGEGGFHPDFHILEPDGKFIRVEQMRKGPIAETQMRPHESRYQVFIIDPVESMHISAANAFLKTLEEAPGSSVFFLIAVNPASLLPTIKSRCQHFSFQPVSATALAGELFDRGLFSEEDAGVVARLCNGSVGKALKFDLEQHRTERAIAHKFVTLSLGEGSIDDVFKMSALLVADAESFQQRLDIASSILRDVMLLSSAGSSVDIINVDQRKQLIDLAREHSPRMIAALLSEIAGIREPLVRNVRIDTVSERIMMLGRRKSRSRQPAQGMAG